MTDGLAQWLGEQLDEDGRITRAVTTPGTWRVGSSHGGPTVEGEGWTVGSADTLDGAHIATHDPARVLREIDIDRELLCEYEQLLRAHARHKKAVEELAADIEHENQTGRWEGPGDPGTRQGALRREADYLPAMLHVVERWAKSKAAVYDQRPGYREEWRP